MRALLVGALLVSACVTEAPASVAQGPIPPVDLSEARFFARTTGTRAEEPLALEALAAEVMVRAPAVRTHLTLVVRNPGRQQVEAVLRLPVPPGAAVTRAVLHVEGRAMEGAFVERARAQAIYRSITERRRDPALVTWDGPEWVDVSIFPVEPGATRTFELEWVEPAATVDATLWYRVPVVGHRGRLVGRPAVLGGPAGPIAVAGRVAVPLGPAPGPLAAARTPGDPLAMVLARGAAPASQPDAPRPLVVVAETSAAMGEEARRVQRRTLAELCAALPPDTQVTLLAGDWSMVTVAEQVRADAAEAALARLDAVPSLGALDLERVLLEAADRATSLGAGAVVFVGRGLDAFGGDAIEAPLARLRAGRVRLFPIGAEGVLAPLADAAWLTGGRPLDAVEAKRPATAATLLRAAGAPPAGAPGEAPAVDAWVPLETVAGEVRWLARVVGGLPPQAQAAAAEDLEALVARARLLREDGERSATDRPHGVVTPLTSLLVLERDEDYARFRVPEPRRDPSWWTPREHVVARPDTAGAAARTEPAPPRVLAAAPDDDDPIPEWMKKKGQDDGPPRTRRAAAPVGLRGPRLAPDPQLARALAEQAARQNGLLGALGSAGDSRAASIFGRDRALGRDATNALGSLIGDDIAAPYGLGRLGLLGGFDRFLVGNLGTVGKCVGPGCSASGTDGGVRSKPRPRPRIRAGAPRVDPARDPALVLRTAREQEPELVRCYQPALAQNPRLRGHVVVEFKIAPRGHVVLPVTRSSTLHDREVEACLARVVDQWTFPAVAREELVHVALPLTLRPDFSRPRVEAAAPLPDVAPLPTPWELALAVLRDGQKPVAWRVASAADLLGEPRTDWPQVLAWRLARVRLLGWDRPVEAHLVTVELLRLAGDARDAVRLASELAPSEPARLAAELRRAGATTDAARVEELARRPTLRR